MSSRVQTVKAARAPQPRTRSAPIDLGRNGGAYLRNTCQAAHGRTEQMPMSRSVSSARASPFNSVDIQV